MDTFENNEQPQVETSDAAAPAVPQTPPEHQIPEEASSSGSPERKPSPFADSPYEIRHQPEFHYQPQAEKPPKPPRQERVPGRGRRAASALLTVALVTAGCLVTASAINSRWEARTTETVTALNQRISDLESRISSSQPSESARASRLPESGGLTPAQLYEKNVDSVVAISSSIGIPDYYGFGTSYGSGFILREDGYVVTNNHVVEDASAVTVTLNDGTEYPAKVVGSDASNDVALLKIEETGLPAVTIGSSSDLQIGDMVAAIGNAVGTLTSSQTVGYVSGINREISVDNTIINMLQTDAAINSGSSGGPLFNMQGQVIGITTAKYSGTTSSGASIEGVGFAIPIDDVKDMLSDLADLGYITGAYLGVTVMDMDADVASTYGLPIGAYVDSVEAGGSADRAGVKPKDIITDLGGCKVGSIHDLTRSLRNFKAGDTTTVTVVRGGAELTLNITLDEKPKSLNNPFYQEEPEMPDSGDYDEWYEYFRWYFGE